MTVRVGTAGWAIPQACRDQFPCSGSALERYASRLNCAEINTTFYRPHRPATFERWAASTPAGFRFAVKIPRTITHERRLAGAADLLDPFLEMIAPLGDRLGPLLVQLPPTLIFGAQVTAGFLSALRRRHRGGIALEPRHSSWFDPEPERLLVDRGVARVAADPARVPTAAEPGGAPRLRYWRLHGSPRMYWSAYPDDRLQALARVVAGSADETWVIFDNTTSGAAVGDALKLSGRL